MQTIAAPEHSRAATATGGHVYLRPSVRPVPRPQVVDADTW